MGVDIKAIVEVRRDGGTWHNILDVSRVLGRDYDMYGVLFDVRNGTGLKGLFGNRGLPEGVSRVTRFDLERVYGITHVSFEELNNIDMSVRSETLSDRIFCYSEGVLVSSFSYSSELEELMPRIDQGEQVDHGGKSYRKNYLSVGECLNYNFYILLSLMEVLEEHYGTARLVVGFG